MLIFVWSIIKLLKDSLSFRESIRGPWMTLLPLPLLRRDHPENPTQHPISLEISSPFCGTGPHPVLRVQVRRCLFRWSEWLFPSCSFLQSLPVKLREVCKNPKITLLKITAHVLVIRGLCPTFCGKPSNNHLSGIVKGNPVMV